MIKAQDKIILDRMAIRGTIPFASVHFCLKSSFLDNGTLLKAQLILRDTKPIVYLETKS